MELVKDDEKTYKDKNLIRRRFYLSKESLKYFDALVIANNTKPSILLDEILKEMAKKGWTVWRG